MMTHTKSGLGIAASLILLAACGDNDNDGSGDPLPPVVSFDSLTQEAERLDTRAQSLPTVAAADIPDMGVVTYDGVVALNPGDGPDLVGNLTLETSFMTNAITGGVSSIINENDEAYTGSLNVVGDVVRVGDTNIDAELSGNINNADGELTTVLTEMSGAFQGLASEMVSGTVSGVISGGDYGATGTGIDGTFAAEQQ